MKHFLHDKTKANGEKANVQEESRVSTFDSVLTMTGMFAIDPLTYAVHWLIFIFSLLMVFLINTTPVDNSLNGNLALVGIQRLLT
uniref:Uncharacterized protein n=1 Tax=Tetranychus urticae TaxID=32264 RepID=T1JSS0_TETUR